MTRKGIITSVQETVVAAGKSAAEGAKALAGEVANAAATAAATAKAATTAAAGVVLDKALHARKAPGLSSMGGGSLSPLASLALALLDGAALHQPRADRPVTAVDGPASNENNCAAASTLLPWQGRMEAQSNAA